MADRKHPQSTVDRALAALDEDVKAEFMEWARSNPAYVDMQRWLAEYGQVVTVAALQRWYRREFPVGAEALLVNSMARDYAGIAPDAALKLALGIGAKALNDVMMGCDKAMLEMLRISKPDSMLHGATVLLKEVRTAAAALQRMETNRDRRELELAGGYRLAELVRKHCKDTSHEDLINEFLLAALVELESEV